MQDNKTPGQVVMAYIESLRNYDLDNARSLLSAYDKWLVSVKTWANDGVWPEIEGPKRRSRKAEVLRTEYAEHLGADVARVDAVLRYALGDGEGVSYNLCQEDGRWCIYSGAPGSVDLWKRPK